MNLADVRLLWRDYVVMAWRSGLTPWVLGSRDGARYVARMAQIRRHILETLARAEGQL